MPTEHSFGGVVLGESGTVVLVRHKDNTSWLFPKGRKDGDESDEDAARREIFEETGLSDLELLDYLGSYTRFALLPNNTDDRSRLKEIHMFLFSAKQGAELRPTLEIEEATWVPLQSLVEHIGNSADRAWFVSVFERVRQAVQRD